MGTAERRNDIMKILCRRRFETIPNLATEFGVSIRTIQRDIESLSISEPIYTQCGRYYGGVYVVEGYTMTRMYMKDSEIQVLQKIDEAVNSDSSILTYEEQKVLKNIILEYTKPKVTKERNKL